MYIIQIYVYTLYKIFQNSLQCQFTLLKLGNFKSLISVIHKLSCFLIKFTIQLFLTWDIMVIFEIFRAYLKTVCHCNMYAVCCLIKSFYSFVLLSQHLKKRHSVIISAKVYDINYISRCLIFFNVKTWTWFIGTLFSKLSFHLVVFKVLIIYF